MSTLENVKSKILTIESAQFIFRTAHFFEKKIVFTNGVFDLLHLGHVDYLSKAKDCGNILVVGINSDASVKTLNKGTTRPLQDEVSRATILAALHFVDYVIVFNEETPYELIKAIQPDVLAKGADYKVEQIAGHDIVLAKGGEVKLIEFLEGYSTSKIENKILGRQ